MTEDLGVKIVDKEKVYWERLKENVDKEIENAKNSIIINEHILELIKEKLK